MIARRGIVLGSLAYALVARAVHAESPPAIDSLDALFAMMARSNGFYARFHEEKKIALLVLPLKNDGTLHFDRRHGLARHTLVPSRQSVLLSGNELTLWDGQRTETLSLSSSASLRALAQAFALMLAADRAGLERACALSFQSDGTAWRLSLLPTAPDLKKLVTEIGVAGDGPLPKTLRVREASGDESLTTLLDVDMGKTYSEREADAVFRVPPGTP